MLGISCDSHHSHRSYSTSLGNIPYPLVSDFHPHGQMVKSYGLWNEENGASRRAVIIVDKDGIVRFNKEYAAGTLPDPLDIVAELDRLR